MSKTPESSGNAADDRLKSAHSDTARIGDTMASGSNWRLAEAEKMVGQAIGRYEIREILGYGGMGVVYRAADPTLERDVALKVLFDIGGETSKQRFLNEARAAAKLESIRTVVVHEVGEYEGKPFIVMEMVPGALWRIVSERTLSSTAKLPA